MERDRPPELIPLSDPAAVPEFDVVLRGYDRRQVDAYLDRMEADTAAVQNERDSAASKAASLAKQVDELQREVTAARRQLVEGARPTYAGLGARVEQLLRLAEEEATRLRQEAERDAADRRAAADAVVRDAERQAAAAEEDFETVLAVRRQQAEQDLAGLRTATEQERRQAADDAERQRRQAAEAGQRMQAEAAAAAEATRQSAERRAAQVVQDAERRAEQIVAEAQAEAEQRRASLAEEITDLVRRRDSINQKLASLRDFLVSAPTAHDEPLDAGRVDESAETRVLDMRETPPARPAR